MVARMDCIENDVHGETDFDVDPAGTRTDTGENAIVIADVITEGIIQNVCFQYDVRTANALLHSGSAHSQSLPPSQCP